jgi:hypothetical protein
MGKRKRRQQEMWLATNDLPKSPGHPFYQRLNAALEEAGFDRFAERSCERFYAGQLGRPSLVPGRYFRLLLLGYFEGLDSERGMAWRAADSLAIRSFIRQAQRQLGCEKPVGVVSSGPIRRRRSGRPGPRQAGRGRKGSENVGALADGGRNEAGTHNGPG